ncbi:hypothetical protein GUITHDRAFT_114931 [Guillardia theta CCMP2712]|uniref:Uncharacterized protein n=1 Tax=Guillardia theta (strain CCMP2712) TaxID=905079 RepID=L1IS06_GUITC|nr:hypothetical protein GUITHDRAFT_114931 [Guillardia theta CCMP2712]EKX39056.1 hypothetical protein GUITHDRAFT_114931 [Guillardia theta CCMP2712]|eukprot:XP_005826036.1 hypothetical protein GUITHDRAFT_114931 [Guillardia theta CCMP2712]
MFNLFSLKRQQNDELCSEQTVDKSIDGLDANSTRKIRECHASPKERGHVSWTIVHDCTSQSDSQVSHPSSSAGPFHAACSCCARKQPMQQTLEEMDFERGIWGAAALGDLERMRTLLEERQRDVNACDKSGYTALHYAARSGKDQICQLLLDRKAAVNACAGEFKLLAKNGANLALVDIDGETCLHKARTLPRSTNAPLVEYLMKEAQFDMGMSERNRRGQTAAEVASCEEVSNVFKIVSNTNKSRIFPVK